MLAIIKPHQTILVYVKSEPNLKSDFLNDQSDTEIHLQRRICITNKKYTIK